MGVFQNPHRNIDVICQKVYTFTMDLDTLLDPLFGPKSGPSDPPLTGSGDPPQTLSGGLEGHPALGPNQEGPGPLPKRVVRGPSHGVYTNVYNCIQ